jgi:hypothetical protein
MTVLYVFDFELLVLGFKDEKKARISGLGITKKEGVSPL